ncbi:MAG: DJ-1/PfpI family protein, partial [Gemmatimonadales bacterium]
MKRRVIIVLFDGCELLDFGGPGQALHEASLHGGEFETIYAAPQPSVLIEQGLRISDLPPLPEPRDSDWIIVPGYTPDGKHDHGKIVEWLRRAATTEALIASVCTGTFLLGQAGLIDGKQVTTHWKRVTELQARFPRAKVIGDRLFVRDGRIVSSAGIAAGIDMMLALIEEENGPAVASDVAREMVVYLRRDASHRQESVYLDYQTHLSPSLHRLQQWLIANPGSTESVAELAEMANMSTRHLSRLFRKATGIGIHDFRTRLRVERARVLVNDPSLTLEAIATACGFAGARQLRRQYR